MNGSDLQIPGRCHLHRTSSLTPPFVSARKIIYSLSTIAPLPAAHRARTTSAPCRLPSTVHFDCQHPRSINRSP